MRSNVLLWIVQGLLALIFLFVGGMKLILPLEALTGPILLPGPFMRFIGVAEVLLMFGSARTAPILCLTAKLLK